MSLSKELLELLTVILPLIISMAPIIVPPQTVARWVVAIIATATTSLLSTGLMMMRATTSCFLVQPQCDATAALVSYTPGLFDRYKDCALCIPVSDMGILFSVARSLNEHIFGLAIGSWAACSLTSIFLIGRFIQWGKKQRNFANLQ